MSPFASTLHTLRMQHGICQTELAELLGYEQTYISALEVGKKGPPTQEFVEKLILALNISGEERERLLEAVDASSRKLVIDNDMPQDVYWLLRDFKRHLHDLSLVQIQLLRQIIVLKDSINKEPKLSISRVKRRKKVEVTM
jgi:predicted transcriptional regulator